MWIGHAVLWRPREQPATFLWQRHVWGLELQLKKVDGEGLFWVVFVLVFFEIRLDVHRVSPVASDQDYGATFGLFHMKTTPCERASSPGLPGGV